ncbi:peptidylprolyl isomerase [Thalassoglobus sp.]|uniref:peptidylprolyl isomerase n=1 Tax=Thalassoglobus sp. TaxID=2795869 RepID=UPI003AA8DC70
MRIWISCLFLSLLTASADAAEPKNLADEIVATVNSRKITGKDLQIEFFQKQLAATPTPQTQDQLIEQLIDRELIKQFLKKRNVTAEQVLIDERMNAIRKLVESKGDDLEKVLGSLGLQEDSLVDMIALQLAWNTHVTRTLTESRIQEFWKANKSQFDGTEIKASQIFKRTPTGTSDEETLKQLKTLREEIVAQKMTFADAAKMHSDSPSGSKGGDLGTFEYYGRVAEPIAAAAFETQPGKISEPFRSPYGLHIVMVHERNDGDHSLEDARAQVVKALSKTLWDEQVARERKNARIQISN